MVRGRKRGRPAKIRDNDGDFNPRPSNATKKNVVSPSKKTTGRRKSTIAGHDLVDEDTAAITNNTFVQQVENEESTYSFSQKRPAAKNTPRQSSARKNAAQGTRRNSVLVDPSFGSFETDLSGEAVVAAGSGADSKVVVLKVLPDRLRELVEEHSVQEKTLEVTLKIPPEKLRRPQQELVEGEAVFDPTYQPKDTEEGEAAGMAPLKEKNPHDVLDDHFKDVIQNLYDLGSITHGYLPESHGPLVQKSIDLSKSWAALSNLTAEDSTHPAAPTIRSILIPPEVIDYVANGRNPDIYTREFVEKVQRGNQVLNGKMQAFGSFAEIYARETKSSIPDMADDMDRLMEHSGGFEKDPKTGDWKMKDQQSDGS